MRVLVILALAAICVILAAIPSVASEPIASFGLVWDSGETLNNLWCLGVGDIDDDRQIEIAAASWNPGVVHLYELSAWGGCVETRNSGTRDTGLVWATVIADTDRDGRNEILVLSYTTGRVLIFEQADSGYACVSDDVREYDPYRLMGAKTIVVGDTDRDGRAEIIVISGDIHSGTGQVAIWEQNGQRGQHAYTRVFSYRVGLYLVNAAIGDSDNDGWPEVVLGVANSGSVTVNRLEYDRSARTWVHREFATGARGRPMTPCVADVDRDGRNELLMGSDWVGSAGCLYVLDNTGPNSYRMRFRGEGPLHGFVSAVAAGHFTQPHRNVIAAGSFYGDVVLWQYNHKHDTFDLYAELPGPGGTVQGLALADIGKDGLDELVVALGDRTDELRLYRRLPGTAGVLPPEGSLAVASQLVARPNPFRETTVLRVADKASVGDARIDVFDCRGRRVRAVSLSGSDLAGAEAAWDGCDEQGRPAPAGAYYCRLVTRGSPGPAARVVLLR